MQKKLPFKPLMSAVIITSLFAIANPASALTKVSGITIDGEDKGTLSGATLEIGSDLSTILVKPGKTTNVGKPILANNGSKLVMKGEDITLNGENSEFGIWVYDYSKEALQKPPLPSRMEQKCSVRLFLTTPECAVFFANTIVEY